MSINRRGFMGHIAMAASAFGPWAPKAFLADGISHPAGEASSPSSTQQGKQESTSSKRFKGYIRPNTIQIIEQSYDLIVACRYVRH
jgi:hypothetical protein